MITILVWAFGMAAVTIMLASAVRQRREHLVDVLKKHVQDEVGDLYPPPAPASTTTSADSEPSKQSG